MKKTKIVCTMGPNSNDENIMRHEQLKIAQEILGDKLVAVQNQYSPIHLDTQIGRAHV